MAAKEQTEFYTIEQIAEMTQTDRHTVNFWCESHQLKWVNLGTEPGKKIPRKRVRRDWFETFLASRSPSPTPPATKRKAKKQDADVESFIH